MERKETKKDVGGGERAGRKSQSMEEIWGGEGGSQGRIKMESDEERTKSTRERR